MKKIFLTALAFVSVLTLTASALNVSFSDDGMDLDADIMRQGDYIYMNYKIDGLNSPASLEKVDPAKREQLSQISKVDVNMVMSCSTKKMKIKSMNLVGVAGQTLPNVSETDWLPITQAKDLQKLEELCNKI